jgi:hypothetical protein
MILNDEFKQIIFFIQYNLKFKNNNEYVFNIIYI